mmetsp:Transcript_50255/g.98323  ORF Transcript_50255/g.98323 Transcript_50255/m.98323 type:complete len:257 (-) Transcript_50255:927-1697(-)
MRLSRGRGWNRRHVLRGHPPHRKPLRHRHPRRSKRRGGRSLGPRLSLLQTPPTQLLLRRELPPPRKEPPQKGRALRRARSRHQVGDSGVLPHRARTIRGDRPRPVFLRCGVREVGGGAGGAPDRSRPAATGRGRVLRGRAVRQVGDGGERDHRAFDAGPPRRRGRQRALRARQRRALFGRERQVRALRRPGKRQDRSRRHRVPVGTRNFPVSHHLGHQPRRLVHAAGRAAGLHRHCCDVRPRHVSDELRGGMLPPV